MIDVLAAASFLFIAYTYFGYLVVLWFLPKNAAGPDPEFTPSVSVVIPAFNEADCITETLESILASDYPADSLEVIVISDESTDGTDAKVRAFPAERVKLLRQAKRSGQSAAIAAGSAAARGDILIQADASGIFRPDTIRRLACHFADERIGAVSGYKATRESTSSVGEGDGVYARYDMTLRRLESETGSSWVGCEGGLFAVRRPLAQIDFPLNIANDNALCYVLYEKGYRHRFEARAVAIERPSKDFQNEFRRKVRIIVLQLRGVYIFRRLFNPFKHPAFFFQNVSHKLFRWLVPFALFILWAASGLSQSRPMKILFALQCLFYALAVAGIVYERRRKAPKWLSIPAYFTTVNLAGLFAWGGLLRDYAVWTPPTRSS